jgi:SPP1 family predicted phage head-tail adaptor
MAKHTPLHAGQLRERITLQQPTNSTDGSVSPTYSNVRSIRAEVLPASAGENANDRQVQADIDFDVRMWHPGYTVLPTWRISWEGRTLNIVSAYDPDQRGRELTCECSEDRA